MKTVLVFAIACLFSLFGFAADGLNLTHSTSQPLPIAEPVPAPAPPAVPPAPIMLGHWKSINPIFQNGIRIYTEFVFSLNDFTLVANCQFRNPTNSLVAYVTSQAIYRQNLIYVTDTVEATVQDNFGRFCQSRFQPSTWEFYMQSPGMNRAMIFAPVPYQFRVQIERVTVGL